MIRLIRNLIPIVLALFVLFFFFIGCAVDSPTDPANRPPTKPVIDSPSGTPSHGSSITTLNPILRWMCTDPDGDLPTYDVRFDTASPPILVVSDQQTNSFSPGPLKWGTRYYWQVTARDPAGHSTNSDIWTFTTQVQPPHLSVGTTELSFSAVQSGSLPDNQIFSISNTGGGLLSWSVLDGGSSWLDLDQSSDSSNSATVTVSVNTTNLNPGLYDATITVSSSNADNSPLTVAVVYQVTESFPWIALSHTEMEFSAVHGSTIPGSQMLSITNMGGGTLDFSISDGGVAWLDETPLSGSSNNQTVTVSVNTTNLTSGLYSATISVSSDNAGNSPQTIEVSYQVAESPAQLDLSETALMFEVERYGSLPANQTFVITNAGGGLLNWSVSDGGSSWLELSPTSGNSNSTTITASVNTAHMNPGQYNATITVSSDNAENSPQTIAVSYTVTPRDPHIVLSETMIEFHATQGAATPDSQSFTITNSGDGTLNWSVSDGGVNWLDQDESSGSSNSATITVSINTTELVPGQHNATITVLSDNADNSPRTIAVNYIVEAPFPHIVLSETAIAFNASQGGTSPDPQTFAISNTGGGLLNWSISHGEATWLDVSPENGSSNSELIAVSVTATDLSPGQYDATITVSSDNADNSPQTIAITYTVSEASAWIELSDTAIAFKAVQGSALPAPQTFTITNSGSGVLDWSISDGDVIWLDEDPLADNSNNQLITVSVNTTDLSPGPHDAVIMIASSNADNGPLSIEVIFTVTEAPYRSSLDPHLRL